MRQDEEQPLSSNEPPGKDLLSGFSELTRPRPRQLSRQALVRSIPNLLTLAAVLCGLSSIRLSGEGDFAFAAAAIFGAVALDVADGFLARRLSAVSAIGAELDSLADFLNFGVAPAMLLYRGDLHVIGIGGWLIAAAYVLATGLRLARFNVQLKSNPTASGSKWFLGLPSTGAAVFVLIAEAAAKNTLAATAAPFFISGVTVLASALMVSELRVPTLASIFQRKSR
ncbi:MAG: CDP-alcohol phosphatidyltransferase family protein [Rhodomicrobium sp.]